MTASTVVASNNVAIIERRTDLDTVIISNFACFESIDDLHLLAGETPQPVGENPESCVRKRAWLSQQNPLRLSCVIENFDAVPSLNTPYGGKLDVARLDPSQPIERRYSPYQIEITLWQILQQLRIASDR